MDSARFHRQIEFQTCRTFSSWRKKQKQKPIRSTYITLTSQTQNYIFESSSTTSSSLSFDSGRKCDNFPIVFHLGEIILFAHCGWAISFRYTPTCVHVYTGKYGLIVTFSYMASISTLTLLLLQIVAIGQFCGTASTLLVQIKQKKKHSGAIRQVKWMWKLNLTKTTWIH